LEEFGQHSSPRREAERKKAAVVALNDKRRREFRALLTRDMNAGRAVAPPAIDGTHPGDRYGTILENPFRTVTEAPLSTFSIDVDTASYAKARRYVLENRMLPPPDAVRIEEFVNYFDYDYAPPAAGGAPFSAHVEVAGCPWQPKHRLVRVGLKGRVIENDRRPASNLVFLLDVSGSMAPEDRLPRVRRAMRMLVEQLGENDRVAIVVYASAEGLVLPSTLGLNKDTILSALDNLQAGGSTNGGAGIQLAYRVATDNFIKGGTNRVILCTDGDFNVGVTSTDQLEQIAAEKAETGVFLSVLGFGFGNHNDQMLERLAGRGNGNYAYIDSEEEAKKVLVDQMGGTLVTIAKDVKIQIEFNPRLVGAYRLIGYEDRLLAAEDFNDDTKDAGEIGAGHTVTALYELAPPAGAGEPAPPAGEEGVDPLKYQAPLAPTEAAATGELLTLKLRYKDPDGRTSHEPLVFAVSDSGRAFGQASGDFKFATAVASFGMLLRHSSYRGNATYAAVLEIAQEAQGPDKHGYRKAFLELVRATQGVAGQP
jgi:Ca-activated chloride channel family protein